MSQTVCIQAERRKDEGNLCFKKRRFGAAIDAYTEAIALCPDVVTYWTNRALCYQQKEEWENVAKDCRRALEIDRNSIKARYLHGCALLEMHDYTASIKELEKVMDMTKGKNVYSTVEGIHQRLAKAKYKEWEEVSSKQLWQIQNLKESCQDALAEYHFIHEDGYQSQHVEQLELLEEVFRKATVDNTPSEVPDHLCCKISRDVLRDPVVTPSGVTYERAMILEHLEKVGSFDPMTRVPLAPHQLVPNLAIKAASQAFLKDHGWAYGLCL